MTLDEATREVLLRHLDGRSGPEEGARVLELLRSNPEARAFVWAVADQAVMIADLERIRDERRQVVPAFVHATGEQSSASNVLPLRRTGRWLAVAAAAIVVLAAGVFGFQSHRPWVLRVGQATGASQVFGARGALRSDLLPGTVLRAGDTLENRSCDAWIELETREGARLTLGGHSTLRMLEADDGTERVALLEGSAWFSPSPRSLPANLTIETPTLIATPGHAQLDLQASPTETLIRVNRDQVRVRRRVDDSEAVVPAAAQMHVSLSRLQPLAIVAQPAPVEVWDSDATERPPEVTLGRWLAPTSPERRRLGAEPLLWPVPGRDPVLLHVVGLSVARTSDRPVALHAGGSLVFRGRTERPARVRFGLIGQRMRGVFAGKFEMDVTADKLGVAGTDWEVSLPLVDFKPVQAQPTKSPDGLELTDVYALTIEEDAGLEIHRIEVRPNLR